MKLENLKNSFEKDNIEFKKLNSKLNTLEKDNIELKKENSKLNEKINIIEKENKIIILFLHFLEEYKKKKDLKNQMIKKLDILII